jgi:hypothetical protein
MENLIWGIKSIKNNNLMLFLWHKDTELSNIPNLNNKPIKKIKGIINTEHQLLIAT